MTCPSCRSVFCLCVPDARPGSVLLAPLSAGHTRGAWGCRKLYRATVLRVDETPTGRFVVVEARGLRRRVRLDSCRPVETLVEVPGR